MIEPQNTMLPVAEPRPVDAPQGEGEGFGAMLAQSLGLAPQVNPDAVQQINTEEHPTGQGQEDPAGEQAATGQQSSSQAIEGVVGAALQMRAAAPGAIAAQGDRAEQPPAAPGEPVVASSGPVGSQRFMRTDRGVAPLPTLPTPPTTEPAPHVVRPDTFWEPSPLGDSGEIVAADGEMTLQPVDPGDSIWKPGTTSEPVATAVPSPPDSDGVGPATQSPSVPAQAPDIGPPDPVVMRPPVDEPVAPPPDLTPTVAKPVQVEVDRGRTIPEPPALDSMAPTAEAADSAPKAAGSNPVVPPAAATPQRIELTPERPVRLEPAPLPTVVDRPAVAGEPATAPVTEPVTAEGGPGLGTVQAASTTSTGNTTTPAGMQPQASALAERVMQAIDLQRTQPPPRSMVVDIPELEGLRLVVSVRSAGHVSVTPASNTANPDVFAPFATDLSRVLAERGFVMNGDSRRQGYNPYDQDEAPPAPRRSGSFRRPVRVDNDLRI